MSTSTKAGPSSSDRPILEVRQICKSFPGVRVLKSVNLSIWPGEVHAFMGENGAGKSTLMKILAGAYRPDSGEILLDGKPIHLRTPHEARLAGIGIIYQELTVAPNLTVSGNVFLGSELRRFGFVKDTAQMDRKTQEVLDRLGARFKATQRAAHLAVAEQQQVEIALEIARVIPESLAAKCCFSQLLALNHRAHGAIEHQDPLRHDGVEPSPKTSFHVFVSSWRPLVSSPMPGAR